MKAAVVTSFDEPPHYLPYEVPTPADDDQQLVDVLAVGLHPRVRSGASGRHYTSTGTLPMIPGIDGVARLADGKTVYFAADDELTGPMAEQTVIDVRRTVEIPDDPGVIQQVAAAMNPAMSSWVALRRRVPIQPGQSLMVLGATGNAGTMAIRVAKLLGAGRVIGAGRDETRLQALTELGADEVVRLTSDSEATAAALSAAAAEADIVIDYLWGEPAAQAMTALITAREDRSRLLDWVQIGSIAGPTMELPSTLLRSSNLRVQGNGQGAISGRAYLAELPSLVERIVSGAISITPRPVPLADVEAAWLQPDIPGGRTVIVPADR